MRLTKQGAVVGTLTGIALATMAGQAGAQAVDPEQLAQGERIDEAYPFVSPIGEQLVFWKVQGGPERPLAVRVRTGGAFGPAQELSNENNAELPPKVAFDPSGRMIAAWGIATTGALAASALREPGGLFGSTRNLGACTRFVDLSYGPTGKLAVACSILAGPVAPNDQIAYGIRTGIGEIGPTTYPMASVNDSFLQPGVAWGADGDLAVAWNVQATGTRTEVRLRSTPATGPTSTSVLDSADDPAQTYFHGVAVGPDGTTVVSLTNTTSGVKLYRKPAGGAVQAPLVLAPGTGWGQAPVPDASGTMHVVVYVPAGPTSGRYEVRTLSPAGALSAPVTIVADDTTQDLAELLVAPDGTEYALITDDGGTSIAQHAPNGAGFGAPTRIAGPDARWPHGALTAGGDVVVSWTREAAAGDERAMVGGLDAGTPPALADLRVPGALVAGTTGTFAATATDTMGLRSVRWDFGDGTAAATASAEHAYAAPGRYVASVTATDRAGNTSSDQRTVTVVAAPTEGGGGSAGGPGPDGGGSAAPDRTAPTVRLRLGAKLSFTTLRRRGLTVRVVLSEPADLAASLFGRVRRATIARAGELVLAERSQRHAARGTRTLRLKPSARLLGRRRALRLVVRVTATDAAGNRRTVARTVRVRR